MSYKFKILKMKELVINIISGIILLIAVLIVSLVSGTILWIVWPYAIPAVLPGLIANGIISSKLTWFQSVCLVWFISLFVKTKYNNK